MELKTCGCGRSPTGRCQGWHSLDDEEYMEKLDEWVQAIVKFHGKYELKEKGRK
jgi:hypothetical protein